MKDAIVIREADLSDIPFMTSMLLEACASSGVHIERECLHQFPETEAYIKGWSPEKEIGLIAETENGIPVGAVWIRYVPELGHNIQEPLPEITIAIRTDYRRKGIAGRLMGTLYEKALQKGISKLSLGVHKDNSPAINLYKKQGWKEDSHFKEYIMMNRRL